MRPISYFALVAVLAAAPVGAQSSMQPADPWQRGGPNAQTSQRALGPNAVVSQRPAGPNAAIAQTSKLIGKEIDFPSCATAGAVRAVPVRRGEPGYGRHLDGNGDGVACE